MTSDDNDRSEQHGVNHAWFDSNGRNPGSPGCRPGNRAGNKSRYRFAPLTLALQAGLIKKNGLDVTTKKIPQASRHLAIQSGGIQCAATTVETWVVWNANGEATKQMFQVDKSYGADGLVVCNGVAKIADIKGKTVAASAPSTAPHFAPAWFLKKNGVTVKDVTIVTMEPGRRMAGSCWMVAM